MLGIVIVGLVIVVAVAIVFVISRPRDQKL